MEPVSYEYGRLWMPVFEPTAFPSQRLLYLVERGDAFEGIVADKNMSLVGIFNLYGRDGWLIADQPDYVSDLPDDFQMLVDATFDEVGEMTRAVASFNVYSMHRIERHTEGSLDT